MFGLNGRLFKVLGVVVLLLGLSLLIPDVRYKVKGWYKALFYDMGGWVISDVELEDGKHQLRLLSPVFHVDTLYPSMTGPAETHHFHVRNGQAPELLWMTGYSTEVRDVADENTLDEAYLCHNNLDYAIMDYAKHWQVENRVDVLIPRLATISQGQAHIDFPTGFGIPLMSDHDLSTATQVLNVNEPDLNLDLRHLITIDYVPQEKAPIKYKPLFQQSVSLLVPIDTASEKTMEQKIQDCSPALPTIAFLSKMENGQLYSGHWVVPEGLDTFRSEVTSMLALPFSTTLHYVSVHVHPYCEVLELKDLTTGEIVFRSAIENADQLTKMTNIEVYSSEQGTPLFKDHRYELICYTNNNSGQERDMMAVMLLYCFDKEVAEKL